MPETSRIPATIRKSEIVVPRSGSITISPPKSDDDDADGLHQLAERPRRGAAGEDRADPDADGELRELGRLEAHRAEDEPAVCAVDRRRDDEHRDAGGERADEEERSERPQRVVVDARQRGQQRRARRRA